MAEPPQPPEERSIPVHCPACGKPVLLTLNLRVPVTNVQQTWRCPHRGCGLLHPATFDAKIVWIARRLPSPNPDQ